MLRTLGQAAAKALDVDLMTQPGFSLDQLMELAGLSVACAIAAEYGHLGMSSSGVCGGRILAICGPGNNGGDGLVAARHLTHFGFDVDVLYPKRPPNPLFQGLVAQLEDLNLSVISSTSPPPDFSKYDLLIDGIFGFSFDASRPLREPFAGLMNAMAVSQVPVAAIDIPSGWDVENGDVNTSGFTPEMLISLTVPKHCSRLFTGKHHYIGGRFLPPRLAEKYNIEMPFYPGTEQCVKVPLVSESGEPAEQCDYMN